MGYILYRQWKRIRLVFHPSTKPVVVEDWLPGDIDEKPHQPTGKWASRICDRHTGNRHFSMLT